MQAAIVGAGELGGAIAAALAVRDGCRDIHLIDETGTIAAGKALDILQSGPVHRSRARVLGTNDLERVAGADVLVLADSAGSPGQDWTGEAGLVLVRRLTTINPTAPVVCTGPAHGWVIERAVAELGIEWTRIMGSATIAFDAAVRALIALEAGTAPSSVALPVAGRPPHGFVVGWESAAIDGAPATTRLDTHAMAGLTRRLPYLWPPGPMALATAACVVVNGLLRGAHRPVPALVALARPGLAGRRVGIAMVHLGVGRVTRATLPDLPPQAQVALDNLLAG